MPDIGPTVTGKQLREKAERFQRELAKKKGQKSQTLPQSPKFIKRASKILDRSYINEGDQPKPLDKATAAMKALAAAAKTESAMSTVNPPSTKAALAGQAKRREEIQEKKKKEEAEKKANAARIASQQKLAGTVQGALKSKFGQSAESRIQEAIKEKKKATAEQNKKTAEALQEAIKKGRSRPMLFEQGASDHAAASNLAYLKATAKMINLLKQHGEKPEGYLPQKALDLMEDEDLKQKMKGKLK